MDRPLFIVYAPPWWRRPGGIALVCGLAAVVPACIVWSTTSVVVAPPSPPRPIAVVLTPRAPTLTRPVVVPGDTTDSGEARRVPERPTAALSTEVSPGVHVTPIGLPAGGVAVPAAPRPDDSEPEN